MRLWTIHPKYLDTKGLVALWRESLLAQKVLEGKTKGYRNHPQLDRFKKHKRPLSAICFYLFHVYREGKSRKYNFDKSKILRNVKNISKISVSKKEIKKEFEHLKQKLKERDKNRYKKLVKIKKIELNPIFTS